MDLCNSSVLHVLLEKHGFHFSKALGQNFLIQQWVPERIAESSEADKNTAVLEIGPGVGCLTKELSLRAGKVVSVELDKRLLPLLDESLADCDNIEIVSGDIMKTDVEVLVKEKFGGMKAMVWANLPYNITSPVLTKLVGSGLFDAVTVMIQKEVALRICAKAGDSDYGALSVFMNYYTEPKMLFKVGPECFMPRPKVESAVIRLKKRETPPAEVKDEKLFFNIVRAAFEQRRKTLSNALGGRLGDISKADIGAVIEECGFDARIRGEALNIEDFAKLSNAFSERMK